MSFLLPKYARNKYWTCSINFSPRIPYSVTPGTVLTGTANVTVEKAFDVSSIRVVLKHLSRTELMQDSSGVSPTETHIHIYEYEELMPYTPITHVRLSPGQTFTKDFRFVLPSESHCDITGPSAIQNKTFKKSQHLRFELPDTQSRSTSSDSAFVICGIYLVAKVADVKDPLDMYESSFVFRSLKHTPPPKSVNELSNSIEFSRALHSNDPTRKRGLMSRIFKDSDSKNLSFKISARLPSENVEPGRQIPLELFVVSDLSPQYFQNSTGGTNCRGRVYLPYLSIKFVEQLEAKARGDISIIKKKTTLLERDNEKYAEPWKYSIIDLAHLAPAAEPSRVGGFFEMRMFPQKVLSSIPKIPEDLKPSFKTCTIDKSYHIVIKAKFKGSSSTMSSKSLVHKVPVDIFIQERLPGYQ